MAETTSTTDATDSKVAPKHFLGLRYTRKNLVAWAKREAVAHVWADRLAISTTEMIKPKGMSTEIPYPTIHVYGSVIAFSGKDAPVCATLPVMALAEGVTALEFGTAKIGEAEVRTITLRTAFGAAYTMVADVAGAAGIPAEQQKFLVWLAANREGKAVLGHTLDDKSTNPEAKRRSAYVPVKIPTPKKSK